MRKIYIDLLRIISICFVIFNHTGPLGYTLFIERTDSPFYFGYMAFSVLCKIAVPVFFMISGALLLKKEESILEVLKKRVLRIALVLLIASVPYYVWLHRDSGLSILGFFKTLYTEDVTTSFWYLYSYLGILLMLPLLQKLAKAMSDAEFLYVIGGYIIVTGILPALELLLSKGAVTLNTSFSAALFTASNIVYVLAGYFLESRVENSRFSTKNMILIGALSLCSIALTCVITQINISYVGLSDLNLVESYFNSFIIVPAFSVFFIVKGIFLRISVSEKIGNIITTAGASVFGTYLIEKILRAATSFVYNFLNPYIGSFLASIVWVIVVAFVGLTFITIIKKLPYISKLANRLI